MPNIDIEGDYWSQNCIDRCLQGSHLLKRDDQQMILRANAPVREINISVIAFFILLHKRCTKIFPDFQIILRLDKNVKPFRTLRNNDHRQRRIDAFKKRYYNDTNLDAGEHSFAFTLRQYVAYAHLYVPEKELIQIFYGYALDNTEGEFDHYQQDGGISQWFNLSEKFTPILVIAEDNYDVLFTLPLSKYKEIEQIIPFDKNNETLFKNCKNKYAVHIYSEDRDRPSLTYLLANLAFYQCLEKLNVLNFYLNDGRVPENSLRAGHLQKRALELYNALIPLIDDLAGRPPVYHFLYSVLLSSKLIGKDVQQTNMADFIAAAGKLWRFCKELVYGLRELAKNIIRHSESKFGVMTCRIYDDERFDTMNPNLREVFRKYQQHLDQLYLVPVSFFEMYVADDGTTGIMDTLLETTISATGHTGEEHTFYESDAKKLRTEKVNLTDMFDSSKGLSLNQQAKRATAHLGLLTLAKLVVGNHGMLRVSTPDHRRNKSRRQWVTIFGSENTQLAEMPRYGTNFHMVLPVKSDYSYNPYFYRETDGIPEITPTYISGMERLLTTGLPSNASTIDEEDPPYQIRRIRLDPAACNIDEEYWDHCRPAIEEIGPPDSQQNKLIFLDLCRGITDTSKLFRFIGNWEMYSPGQPLIVANLTTESYLELLKINHQYTDSRDLPFWNEHSLVLFYSFVTLPIRGYSRTTEAFYFTDILWGKQLHDFYALNKAVRRYHFNALITGNEETAEYTASEIFGGEDLREVSPFSRKKLSGLQRFGIFSGMGDLLPFDLLIKADEIFTLFEKNAAVVLSNEIRTRREQSASSQNNLVEFVTNLPGYKVSGSHFRIGSKIHITDFYYAKRFFQDGFFVTPMAFLVTRTLLQGQFALPPGNEDAIAKARTNFEEGLTLVGYGQYAEMLMNLAEHFLTRALVKILYGSKPEDVARYQGKIKINHDIVSDTEQPIFIKHERPKAHIVVIIPIASTFSTSIKIEEAIYRQTKKEKNIQQPFLNLIYVYNSDAPVIDEGSIEKKFGINNQDFFNREVTIDSFFSSTRADESHIVLQKFLIPVQSQWQAVEDCDVCFRNPPTGEEPLFITDKSFVTPVLIFDEPESKKNDVDYSSAFELDRRFVHYGHAVHDGRHYLFYIKVEEFFRRNRQKINTWLTNLRDHHKFERIHNGHRKTLIIAPANLSNTGFVSLVNEVFFLNTANIVHYDPDNDHVQNFQLFYHKEIDDPDHNLIFIDDVLNTGSTFVKANDFLKFSQHDKRGFDGAFFMIDRSNHYAHDGVVRKLSEQKQHCLCFANVKLPALTESAQGCQLCTEESRYEELVNTSFLDRIQYYFMEKQRRLHPITFPRFHDRAFSRKDQVLEHRHQSTIFLSRIWILHLVYQWFTDAGKKTPIAAYKDFETWKKDLFNQPETKFRFDSANARSTSDLLYAAQTDTLLAAELSNTVLKVLTQSPFTYYKPVKQHVFRWVLNLLSEQCQFVTGQIKTGEGIDEWSFRTLKFLMRRMGLLNSNFLISDDCFDLLFWLYEPGGINDLKAKLDLETAGLEKEIPEMEEKERNLEQERVLKEKRDSLWLKNRTKDDLASFNDFYASQVKELLFMNEARSIRLEETILAQMKRGGSPYFQQLLRILREENGILLLKYWHFIKDKITFTTNYGTNPLSQELRNRGLVPHYRTKTLKAFFNKENKQSEPESEPSFLHYLWLMNYFRMDAAKSPASGYGQLLKDKTETIASKLRDIIFDEDEPAGVFFIVKYRRREGDGYFTAYNSGRCGRMVEANAYSPEYPYLMDFLYRRAVNLDKVEDKNGPRITITELSLRENAWYDVYANSRAPIEQKLSPDLLPADYNHLLLLRINRRELITSSEAMRPDNNDFPQAIVGFYVKKAPGELISTSRIRYLLLLRQPLSEFIKNHHESNEFLDWVDALSSKRASLLTGHGREMLLSIADIPYKKSPFVKPYKEIISTILIAQRFIMDLKEEDAFGMTNEVVNSVFHQYFNPDKTPVNQTYFTNSIKYLARNIFELDQIENRELVDIVFRCPDVIFPFSKSLLDMILFEIVVNAKKNRWIFRDDDAVPGYSKNCIEFTGSISEDKRKYHLRIKNTGPYVALNFMTSLNAPGSLKDADDPSGTYLIKTLLKEFGLGKINFSSEQVWNDFGWFIVDLELNHWYEKENPYH